MRRRSLTRTLLGVGAIGLVAMFVMSMFGNPLQTQVTDRSGPVLIRSIQDMQRFVPAQGNFEVAVVLREQFQGLPTFIYGYEGVLVAHGTVDAIVDLSAVTEDAVDVSLDGSSVTISLPTPQLGRPLVDHLRSEVVDDDGGIVNSISEAFGGESSKTQDLYRAAEAKISAAAAESDLVERAQLNTQAAMQSIGAALGFETVTVTFRPLP